MRLGDVSAADVEVPGQEERKLKLLLLQSKKKMACLLFEAFFPDSAFLPAALLAGSVNKEQRPVKPGFPKTTW
jgi:hypothetical protein